MKLKLYKDFDPSFALNPNTGDVLVNYDQKAIMFLVKNLVMTSYFERKFHSEIGSPMNKLLFDNMSRFDLRIIIKKQISDLLNQYEPRVTVTDITVIDDPDYNRIGVRISFNIKNTLIPLVVDLFLERTR